MGMTYRPHPRDVFTGMFRRDRFTQPQKALLFDAIVNQIVDGDKYDYRTLNALRTRGYIKRVPDDRFNDYVLVEERVFEDML